MGKEPDNLIRKVLQGDRQAFSVLVENYQDLVFNLALRILKNREEAEEAAQDTFLAAYKNLHKFRNDAGISTWLFRICYNTCVSRLRKFRPEKIELSTNHLSSASNEGAERMEQSAIKFKLDNALARLKPDESAILTLFYQEELPVKEIAVIMSLTESNVKVKLHRSRQRLKEIMESAEKKQILNYETSQ